MGKQAELPFEEISFSFGAGFLADHAGQIITEPRIAIVELIANAYDAGARNVTIKWPLCINDKLEVEDDGTGMTADQFRSRWRKFNYRRTDEQGLYVEYPSGRTGRKKRAFGQHGKGRHGAFCFADGYTIETWKDGHATVATVELDYAGGGPFRWKIEEKDKTGHGTIISATAVRNIISLDDLCEWVGAKFLVDPQFQVKINGRLLRLAQLESTQTITIDVPPHGTVNLHQIVGSERDRNTKFHGITWWVNKRMVGEPSWDGLDAQGALLDGRKPEAKRFSFVIEADLLCEDVKDDWRGFHANLRVNDVRDAVRKQIIRSLAQLLAAGRKERKQSALAETKDVLRQLPKVSRKLVGQFVDQIQQECPSLAQGDLARTAQIFATLEKSRSGFELLTRLSACSPDDLDTWNSLMQEWTAKNAEVVLSELKKRLDLIRQLQKLVNLTTADELHDLHPLFEKGLWMFGPEYEAVDFISNRAMATVIKSRFGGTDSEVSRRRPDIVTLSNSSLSTYTSDQYDSQGEVNGTRKVLILELKKSNVSLTVEEMHQGEAYAAEIRKASLVDAKTEIVVYVLGSQIEDADERMVGQVTVITPMVYEVLLRRAHARTFNLQRKLEESHPIDFTDPEVEEILSEQEQTTFSSFALES